MIYIFHGNNWRASLDALNSVTDRFKKGNKIPSIFDCEEVSIEDIETTFSSRPLFHEKQLIILKHLSKALKMHDFLLNKVKGLSSSTDTIIIWENDFINKNSQKIFKELFKLGQVKEFTLKFKKEEKPLYDKRVFQFTDYWVNKDQNNALSLYNILINSGVTSERIFWALEWQIRTLLSVKYLLDKNKNVNQIQNILSLHPFASKKYISQASRISYSHLEGSLGRLNLIDEKIKKEPIKLEDSLFHFLLIT